MEHMWPGFTTAWEFLKSPASALIGWVRTRLLARERMEHDRGVFVAADAILSENTAQNYMDSIEYQMPLEPEVHKAVWQFLLFFKKEGNQFLFPTLRKRSYALCEALYELAGLVGKHMYAPEWTRNGRLEVEPHVKNDYPEGERRYLEALDVLRKSAANARRAYRLYRRAVAQTLIV